MTLEEFCKDVVCALDQMDEIVNLAVAGAEVTMDHRTKYKEAEIKMAQLQMALQSGQVAVGA